ncbi:MAG: lysophospholipase [Bacteroidota bacterium]
MKSVKEFSWSSPDGKEIYAVEWPNEHARAVIGLIHGIGEHARRYDHMAEYLTAAGFGMVGYDRVGYGRSGGKRGYVADYSHYYDGIAQLIIECERLYPDLPVFLYGHSMGGNLVLNYIIKRHPKVAGVIASAPYIKLPFKVNPVLIAVGRLMRNIYPAFSVTNELDTTKLSRSSDIEESYANDPHVHSTVSSRVGVDLMKAAEQLDQFSGYIELPLLIMHGTDDGLTSHDASQAFLNRLEGEDISMKSWPGLYHELHNEPEQKEVFGYVQAWIEKRLVESHRALKSV